jgi:tRNA(fMet)-specific endonuclease VapC
VVAERHYGAHWSAHRAKTLTRVQDFCRRFHSLAFDDQAAEEYGLIRSHLTAIGAVIGLNDLLISSIARVHGLTLVTHNTKESSRVPGLKVEDWQ